MKAFLLITALVNILTAKAQSIDATIDQKSEIVLPKVIEWRRYFH